MLLWVSEPVFDTEVMVEPVVERKPLEVVAPKIQVQAFQVWMKIEALQLAVTGQLGAG